VVFFFYVIHKFHMIHDTYRHKLITQNVGQIEIKKYVLYYMQINTILFVFSL